MTSRCIVLAGMLLVPASILVAQEMPTPWLRAVEDADGAKADRPAKSVRLEVAVRRYELPGQHGGEVALVGVTHIGDAAYYDALGTVLADYDQVLYESVAPAGANGVGGVDDAERALRTREAMHFLGAVVDRHVAGTSTPPSNLDELARASGEFDSRLPAWIQAASRDGWGTPLVLEIIPPEPATADEPSSGVGWRLVSYGADRTAAVEGATEDIVLESTGRATGPPPSAGIQAQIADALGLSFQLHALDYGQEGWMLADMTEPELGAAASERGVDLGPLMDGLAGSGFPAQVGRTILVLLRVADFFSGNQARDLVKLVMVEILADPRAIELAQQAGGPTGEMGALMELILVDRNQVALATLDTVITDHPEARLALFYGAAHMPGLADGLHDRGYRQLGEAAWMTAIEVDLEASNVDPRTLELVRRRIHDALRATGRRERPIEDGDTP